MKISEPTRKILSNFANINPSIMFRAGSVLRTMAPQASVIIGRANLPEVFPKDFGIYDLSKFLGVFSLFEDPELTIKENTIQFKENNRKINMTFCEERTLKGMCPKDDIDIPSDVYGKLTMDKKAMSDLFKAMDILKTPDVLFQSDGDMIVVQTIDTKVSTADNYISIVGKSNKVFKVVLNREAFRKIMVGDYEVSIQYGNRSDSTLAKERFGVVVLKGINLEYMLGSEPSSTYE